jgi:hypothetical protein
VGHLVCCASILRISNALKLTFSIATVSKDAGSGSGIIFRAAECHSGTIVQDAGKGQKATVGR